MLSSPLSNPETLEPEAYRYRGLEEAQKRPWCLIEPLDDILAVPQLARTHPWQASTDYRGNALSGSSTLGSGNGVRATFMNIDMIVYSP